MAEILALVESNFGNVPEIRKLTEKCADDIRYAAESPACVPDTDKEVFSLLCELENSVKNGNEKETIYHANKLITALKKRETVIKLSRE